MLDIIGGGQNNPDVRVTEALFDPAWRLFAVTVDGKSLPALRIEHPRHGNIDCILTEDTMLGMYMALGRMRGDRPT